jgi:hypothetical protein
MLTVVLPEDVQPNVTDPADAAIRHPQKKPKVVTAHESGPLKI